MTEKTVNYTNEVLDEIVEAYVTVDTDEARAAVVAEMAEKFGKTVGSVRAKLVSEGVYVAKTRVSKTGGKRKADVLTALASVLGVAEDESALL